MASSQSSAGQPPRSEVRRITTSSLQPNPHNPRRLFDKQPMDVLRKSIEKVGILVPLTVYKDSARDEYFLLDGERRWRCANDLGMNTVPVNVVREPSLVENIVTMFQIHQHREDWELMPTALKLEVLMIEMSEKNDVRVAELTGLNIAVVRRCKKLLSYNRNYQEMMLAEDPEERVKADFFIELYPVINDRLVKSLHWYRRGKFIDTMLDRYVRKVGQIKSVTDFRVVKQCISMARQAKKELEIGTLLKEFYDDETLSVDHLEVVAAGVHSSAAKITREAAKLDQSVADLDPEVFYGERKMWDTLDNLRSTIAKQLRKADRRPS